MTSGITTSVGSETRLDEAAAQKFLRQIANEPFVCLIVPDDPDEITLYFKGLTRSQRSRLRALLNNMKEEVDAPSS